MIEFNSYTLDNGLRIMLHRDQTTPIAAVNVLYDAGSRDEHPEKTGFAHLFEHLMFGGSLNIPEYDRPLEWAGGQNNAFTGNDITNYYLTIPAHNIETAFWLESDRMLDLAFNEQALHVQRNVVTEEFKQRYLNQPYGDLWLLLRPLAYKVHPYRWATIGKDISHIQNATMEDVRAFYEKFYHPKNAILSVVSYYEDAAVLDLAHKWFGAISKGKPNLRNLPAEPEQTEKRESEAIRPVPSDVITLAFPMSRRADKSYFVHDMISDIFSGGRAARLYENLVKKARVFIEIDAYITADIDPGLFIISGKPAKNVTMQQALHSIREQLQEISEISPALEEIQKVRNRLESAKAFSDSNSQNRAFKLAYAELLGDHDLINHEMKRYDISPQEITDAAKNLFDENKMNILHYIAEKQ